MSDPTEVPPTPEQVAAADAAAMAIVKAYKAAPPFTFADMEACTPDRKARRTQVAIAAVHELLRADHYGTLEGVANDAMRLAEMIDASVESPGLRHKPKE